MTGEKQEKPMTVEEAANPVVTMRQVPGLMAKLALVNRLSRGRITQAGIARGVNRDGSAVNQWLQKNTVPLNRQIVLAKEMNISVELLLMEDYNEFSRRVEREYEFGSGARWRLFRQDLEHDQGIKIHLIEEGQRARPDGLRGLSNQPRSGANATKLYRFHCNAGVNCTISSLTPWRNKTMFTPTEWVIICYDKLDFVTCLTPSVHFGAPALSWPDAEHKPEFPANKDQLIYVTAPPAGEQFLLALALDTGMPEDIRKMFVDDQCIEALDRLADWVSEGNVKCASAQTSFFVIP